MNMPVDRWQDVMKAGRALALKKPPEKESEAMLILKEILPLLLKRGGE
jgi:hypothetical protein